MDQSVFLQVLTGLGVSLGAVLAWVSNRSRGLRLLYVAFLGLALPGLAVYLVQADLTIAMRYREFPFYHARLSGIVLYQVLMGGLCLGLLAPAARRFLFRCWPASPESPLHQYGALMLMAWSCFFLNLIVFYDLARILEELRHENILANILVAFLVQMMMLTAGAGFPFRRNWAEVRSRLGLVKPSRVQILLAITSALALVEGFILFNAFVIQAYFPEVAQQMAKMDQVAQLPGTGTLRVVNAVALALTAGLGEDLFFRGLLQPVLGVFPVAMFFTLLHFHYGPTPLLLVTFTLGLWFAFLRKRCNTTTAVLCHICYDASLLLLSLTQ